MQQRPVITVFSWAILLYCLCDVAWAASPKSSKPEPEPDTIVIVPDSRGDAKTIKLPKVKVKRRPDATSQEGARDPSGFVTTIDAKKAAKRVRDLNEVVRENAGVQVRSLGGVGSSGAVSIRGSAPSQVQVLLDGVPLNHGASGMIDLGALPVDALDNIAIFRGFVPAHLGGAMGGAIALTTRYPLGYQSTKLSASVGSFQTAKLNASHARRMGRWQIMLFGQYLGSGGGFQYYDDRGTPYNTDDDLPLAYRANNVLHSAFGLFSLKGKLHPKVELGITNLFTGRQQGTPGIGNFRSASASLRHLRNLFQVSLDLLQLPVKSMRTTSQLYLVVQADRFTDLDGEIGLGRQQTDNSSHVFGWKLHWRWLPHEVFSLSFSSVLRQEGYVAYDLLANAADHQSAVSSRLQWEPVLQATLSLWQEKLILLAAGRMTVIDNSRKAASGTTTTPSADGWEVGLQALPTGRIGATVHPWPWLWLKSNAGRYVRLPTFGELFGDRGTVIGNPRLKPEAGWMWDAGAVFLLKRRGILDILRLEYAIFLTASEQLIRFVQNSQRTSIAVNIDAAQILGHEVRGKLGLAQWFTLQAEFTWMAAQNLSSAPFEQGKRLPGRPEGEIFVRAALIRPWGQVFYDIRYTTSNVLDRANLRELAPRQLHNLGFSIMPARLLRRLGVSVPWDGLTIGFEIKNLLDTRVEQVPLRPPLPNLSEVPQAIADYSGYPLPGRGFYLTVHWNI